MSAWVRKHPWLAILGILGVALLCIAVVLGSYNRGMCALYGMQTERETRYGAFVGCMVKTSNGWVPRSELRTAAE